MTPALVKQLGNASNKTAGTTLAHTFTGAVAAGNVIVARVLFDNFTTASKPIVSSISKQAGETNNWVLLGAARSTSTSGGAFASGEMWAIQTTVNWAAASYTVTLDSSVTMKAVSYAEWSGVSVTQRSTAGTNYSTTTTAASATTTGTTPVIGDLALGFIFGSNVAAAQAGDTDTTGGAWSTPVGLGSTGSSAATNNFGIMQYKVLTAASHQTLNNSAAMTAGNGSIVAILQALPDPTITQASYRWYDEGTETGAVALAAQDTAHSGDITLADGIGQLRIRLQNTSAVFVLATDDWQLQWEKNASGSWTNVTAASTNARGYNSPNLTEGAATTNRLGAGSGSFVAGKVSEDGLADDVGISPNNYTELLFSLAMQKADLANGDTIRFRVLRNGATAGMTYSVTPTITAIRAQQGTAAIPWSSDVAAVGIAARRGTSATTHSWVTAAVGENGEAPPSGGGDPPYVVGVGPRSVDSWPPVLPWPAGYTPTAGDVALISMYRRWGAVNPPAGWSTLGVITEAVSCRMAVIGRVLTGSGDTIPDNLDSDRAMLTIVRNADLGVMDVAAVTNTGSGNNIVPSSVTTSTDDTLLLTFIMNERMDSHVALDAANGFEMLAQDTTYNWDNSGQRIAVSLAGREDNAVGAQTMATFTSWGDPWSSISLAVRKKTAPTKTWSDDFNRPNGDLESGYWKTFGQYGWTPYVQIDNGEVMHTPNHQGTFAIRQDVPYSDDQFIKFDIVDASKQFNFGLYHTNADIADSRKGVQVEWQGFGEIYWWANGEFNGNPNIGAFTGRRTIELRCVGTRVSLLVDDVERGYINIPTFVKTGRAGQGFGHGNSDPRFDNMSGGGIPFTPEGITGCLGWGQAGLPGHVTLDGSSKVNQFGKPGMPMVLDQASGGDAPALTGDINGEPAITWDGTDWMVDWSYGEIPQPHSVGVRLQITNVAAVNGIWSRYNGLFMAENSVASGGSGRWAWNSGNPPFLLPSVDTNPHTMMGVFAGPSSSQWMDGVKVGSQNCGTSPSTFPALGTPDNKPYMKVTRWACYDRVLTDAEMGKLSTWLDGEGAPPEPPNEGTAAVAYSSTIAAVGAKPAAPITWVGATSPGSPGWAEPVGSALNDIIFVALFSQYGGAINNVPAGFTNLIPFGPVVPGGTEAIGVYWIRRGSSAIPTDWSHTLGFTWGITFGYRGCKTTGSPVNVYDDNRGEYTGGFTTWPFDSVTTTVPGCMIVGLLAPLTQGWQTGMTHTFTNARSTVDGEMAVLDDGVQAAAGPTGTNSVTSNNYPSAHMALLIALAPAGAPPGPFTPAALDLIGWWDASNTAAFTFGTGTAVAQWSDLSGLNHHLTQATTARRPTRSTTMNGKSTVHFEQASTQWLESPADITRAQPFTIALVVRANAGTSQPQVWFGARSSINGDRVMVWFHDNNFKFFAGQDGSHDVGPAPAGGDHMWVVGANGASSTFRKDGVALGYTTPGTFGFNASNFYLGKRNTEDEWYFQGDIAELVLVNGLLTTQQRDDLESYITAKWLTTGPTPNTGTAAVTYSSTVAAVGAAPVVAAKTGTAAVTWNDAVSAVGKRTAKAVATTLWDVATLAAGKRAPKATSTTLWNDTLTAAGKKSPVATATTLWNDVLAASGKRAPKAASTTVHTWVTAAQGVAPIVGAKQGNATVTWSSNVLATGKRVPKATSTTTWNDAITAAGKRVAGGVSSIAWTDVLAGVGKRVPKAASTTTHLWALLGAGKRTPKATTATAHSWALTAIGAAPTVGVRQGSALVNHTWTATAVGKRVARGGITTTYSFNVLAAGKKITKGVTTTAWNVATLAAGKRSPKATVAVAWNVALTAAGKRASRGSAATTYNWATTANGVKPVVGFKQGFATVTNTWTAAAVGKRSPKATAPITVNWSVTAAGKKIQKGTTSLGHLWALSPFGKRYPAGTVVIVYAENVSAVGKRSPKAQADVTYRYTVVALGLSGMAGFVEGIWNDQEVVEMMYGDKQVVEWMMIPS